MSSRRVRVVHFCPWAGPLQDAADFLQGVRGLDLASRVSDPAKPELMRMARLDCDWHVENVRAFSVAAMGAAAAPRVEFLPELVFGIPGAADVIRRELPAGEECWLVITGQHPEMFGAAAGKFFAGCSRRGLRCLYYAFDEASRTMPCFPEIAPWLDVLIHDESPLAQPGRSRLKPEARLLHRSWVANFVPFAAPLREQPEEKILFLGSKLGLTPHRQRQIEFLQRRYGERFVASADHSVAVNERTALNRFKVGLCPEGRKFGVSAMSATHTDRPFWCGCLGMVPVSENSAQGDRLQSLHESGLIFRYAHGDFDSLAAQCEAALAAPLPLRQRIYDHFNRHETVGTVVAHAIASFR